MYELGDIVVVTKWCEVPDEENPDWIGEEMDAFIGMKSEIISTPGDCPNAYELYCEELDDTFWFHKDWFVPAEQREPLNSMGDLL